MSTESQVVAVGGSRQAEAVHDNVYPYYICARCFLTVLDCLHCAGLHTVPMSHEWTDGSCSVAEERWFDLVYFRIGLADVVGVMPLLVKVYLLTYAWSHSELRDGVCAFYVMFLYF